MQSAPNTLDFPHRTPRRRLLGHCAHSLAHRRPLVKLDVQGRPPAQRRPWRGRVTRAPGIGNSLRREYSFTTAVRRRPQPSRRFLAQSIPAGTFRLHRRIRCRSRCLSRARQPCLRSPELAQPRNLLLKRGNNDNRFPSGPARSSSPVAVREAGSNSPPTKSWAGRPFVDAIEIEFGRSLRDQAIALGWTRQT